MPKETGSEFIVNAKIKSLYGFKKFRIPCFADDSGICIGALKNKPGVHSKRFFEKFYNKKELFKYIINKVQNSKNTYGYLRSRINDRYNTRSRDPYLGQGYLRDFGCLY